MDKSTYSPVEITLRMHGKTYSVSGLDWDSNGNELVAAFTKLLVCAGFSPEIIQEADGVRYEVTINGDNLV